jgi:hypothetical protein
MGTLNNYSATVWEWIDGNQTIHFKKDSIYMIYRTNDVHIICHTSDNTIEIVFSNNAIREAAYNSLLGGM